MERASSATHVDLHLRLTVDEYQLLKGSAKPNMTAWVRSKIRELPGGEELPPLDAPEPDVERPEWRPEPLVVGGGSGDITKQRNAFIGGVRTLAPSIQWTQWRRVHGLYEGLRALLGAKFKTLWDDANRWNFLGRPRNPDQDLFATLFDFADIKERARAYYVRRYKVSNVKRKRTKAKNPELFLEKERRAVAAHRARRKAAREKPYEAFREDHVDDAMAAE